MKALDLERDADAAAAPRRASIAMVI